jgi:hypothetical protein
VNGLEIIVSEGALNGLTNYEELMAYSRDQLKPYEGMLVTEDQLGAAKDIVARMRKVAKAASDLRIRTEKEHAAKIALAVKQLKDIAATFTDAAGKIDDQVKAITNAKKQEKREALKRYFLENVGDAGKYIDFEDVEDAKWLNASVTMETAKEQMDESIREFQKATAAVESLDAEPGIKAAVQAEFKRTKSLAAAVQLRTTLEQMAKAQQREREEREAAAKAAEIKPQESTETLTLEQPKSETPAEEVWEITFTVTATKRKFMALREFLVKNGMEYRRA